jgi:hypothetical protein
MVPDSKQSLACLTLECVSPATADLSDMSPFDIVRTMNGEDAAVWAEVDRRCSFSEQSRGWVIEQPKTS